MGVSLEYQEHHFKKVDDVGVAWNDDRVWVCLNGVALFRAKVISAGQQKGMLMVEFTKPEKT